MTGDAQPFAQFRQRGVRLLLHEFQELADGVVIQFGGGAAAVGLGLDGTGGAPPLQETDEEGKIDEEQAGDLAEGVFAAIDGRDDTLPEIVRIRTHGGTSLDCAP